MSNYRSIMWHVFCAKCKQRYETMRVFRPEVCGACGSKWIAVLPHNEFMQEKHIPTLEAATKQ